MTYNHGRINGKPLHNLDSVNIYYHVVLIMPTGLCCNDRIIIHRRDYTLVFHEIISVNSRIAKPPFGYYD